MATNRSGHQPGGGIASKVNVQTPVRTGGGSRSTNPGGVAQIGAHVGDHVTREGSTGYKGEPLHGGRSFDPVVYGNQKALDVGKGGPGTGRTVYGCGTQGQQGPTAGSPRPQGRGILSNE